VELTKDLFVPQPASDTARERISRPSLTFWQDAYRRLRKNKVAMMGLTFLFLLTAVSLLAPMLSKYTYDLQDYSVVGIGPTAEHWFGTDDLGRDVWTRLWIGGRVSLFIGFAAVALDSIIGVLYGGISGYFGGWVDDVMQRFVEVMIGIPGLLLTMLLVVVLKPGLGTLLLAMVIANWIGMARLVRGQVLQLKEQEFVLAARTLGASPMRIILKHLIPNAMGPILVNITLGVPNAIFAEAGLSFIGLGIPIPFASWGTMVSEGYNNLKVYPWMLIFPAMAIALTMLSFNLFGDGLTDALDPNQRGR
jgi:oligopeptide transport system permease protein